GVRLTRLTARRAPEPVDVPAIFAAAAIDGGGTDNGGSPTTLVVDWDFAAAARRECAGTARPARQQQGLVEQGACAHGSQRRRQGRRGPAQPRRGRRRVQ